jgi:hypothetical protein
MTRTVQFGSAPRCHRLCRRNHAAENAGCFRDFISRTTTTALNQTWPSATAPSTKINWAPCGRGSTSKACSRRAATTREVSIHFLWTAAFGSSLTPSRCAYGAPFPPAPQVSPLAFDAPREGPTITGPTKNISNARRLHTEQSTLGEARQLLPISVPSADNCRSACLRPGCVLRLP